jgi:hypothetical protein
MILRIALAALTAFIAIMAAPTAHAQSRKPTAAEVTAIRNCAAKNRDDPDAGEQ